MICAIRAPEGNLCLAHQGRTGDPEGSEGPWGTEDLVEENAALQIGR